ncbi:metalloproteinase inhibitor 2-like [Rhinichthys klamathensis goyatoka]|uniref:metalloproteinase inhibitor 2-like n=1 Tax=Rhinichthys klamathensis goyatoka TaxID=3034132 RepID=UPI0024B600EB|nr:metalloproteinase inhibitor 2-like [Rhinichthys klamathensis goyatoka]
MMSVSLCAALLVCLCVCVSESCTCFPAHPQELFCSSSLVMRAEVTGKKILPGEINTEGMEVVQYDIKVRKVFKGSSDRIKKIKHASTLEIMCTAILGHGQYLLSGYMDSYDRLSISMCDLIVRWDSLSLMQKNNIKYRYQKGCDCKISICTRQPCQPSSESECVLDDWSYSRSEPLLEAACVRHTDGSCSWDTGTAKNHTHTHA